MFAYGFYRWIDGRNYDYERMRCCFILVGLVYCAAFVAAGVAFVILYGQQVSDYDNETCSTICADIGATQSCGYQQCCDPNNFFISYSFSYCDDNFLVTVYLILFVCCFAYAGYEAILLIGLFCRGEGFRRRARGDVIVINNNIQQPMQPQPPPPRNNNKKMRAKQQQQQMQSNYTPNPDAYQQMQAGQQGYNPYPPPNNMYAPYPPPPPPPPVPGPETDFMPPQQPYHPPPPPPAYGMHPDPPNVIY